MKTLPKRQAGESLIGKIILMILVGYGVYVGIQFAPQLIESRSIKSILSSIEADHRIDPLTSEYAATDKVIKLLQINEMNDMTKNVDVRMSGGSITIRLKYERELNLVYKEKKVQYDISRVLR